jgi:hypothetical protein
VTEHDETEVLALVLADLQATLGPGHESLARENARRLRQFIADDRERYLEAVVEATQQDLHDEFIDTDWPACPLHGRHPLWVHAGAWWCEQASVAVAPVGQLATLRTRS